MVTQAEGQSCLVGPLHHWLLVTRQDNPLTMLENIPGPRPALDSHVLFAKQSNQNLFDLFEIYRIGYTQDELRRSTLALNWTSDDPLPPPILRNDLMGAILRIGVPNINALVDKTESQRIMHSLNILNYSLQLTNGSSTKIYTDLILKGDYDVSIQNRTSTYLKAMLVNGDIDLSTGMVLTKSDLNYLDSSGAFFTYRPAFYFLLPTISITENIYVLSFSKSVWASSGLLLILIILFLIYSEKGSDRYNRLEIVFSCIGNLLDQGGETTPSRVSSRITLLSLLVQSLCLLNAFSACIVVLLGAPNLKIKTLEDLINSQFRLTLSNEEFNVKHNTFLNDPLMNKLYNERVYKRSKKEVYFNVEEGVEFVRTRMDAFHVDQPANQAISDTFTEQDKCRLKRIAVYKPWASSLPVQKYSPVRELLLRSLLLVRERGLSQRETKRLYHEIPACYNTDSAFVSVSLKEFHPTLQVMAIGLILAILVIIGEIVLYKICSWTK